MRFQQRNDFFQRVTTKVRGKKRTKPKGLSHQFSKNIQCCIVMVTMKDAPKTRSENTEELESQRECKRKKEEAMKKKGIEKATEAGIGTHYYWSMYNS